MVGETITLHRKKDMGRRIYFLSFFVPFLFLAAAFAVQGVHPFGSQMILTVDLYHQYGPFVAELRDKILSGESLFFSWNIGLGTDFWATYANYAASPLNLIALFFPQKYSPDAIALIACIRAGLSGLFAAMLLSDMERKKKDLLLVGFSSFYALCGWVLSYFWNIMWHDAVALLPLIVLGLRLLIRERKPWLYCISLFVCLWSNYFTGYFICFFLILLFPPCYLAVVEKPTLRRLWNSLFRFGFFSVLAGGMAAALLLPTWYSLQNSSAVGDSFPDKNYLTSNFFDFISRFFIGSRPNIRDGMANVYSGVIILILVPLYFMCKKIRLWEKVYYGLLLAFLYFSFSDRFLNFIWHAFHFPNQIPYRQAFIMSFLLIVMGYQVIRNLTEFSIKQIGTTAFCVFLYIVLYEQIGEGNDLISTAFHSDDNMRRYQMRILSIVLTAALIALYVVVLRFYSKKKYSARTRVRALGAIFLLELFVSTQIAVGMVSRNEGFTGWDFYGKRDREVTEFLEWTEAEGGFVRSEIFPAYICNETSLYQMKGMSIFSSTATESFIRFMRILGLHNNEINAVRAFGLTPVSASLLGLRYFVDLEENTQSPEAFPVIEHPGTLTVRENPDALALGYMVSNQILQFQTPKPADTKPFANTNNLLSHMGVSAPVYETREIQVAELSNMTHTGGNAADGYTFAPVNDAEPQTIYINPTGVAPGERVFLYVKSHSLEDPIVVKNQMYDGEVRYEDPQTGEPTDGVSQEIREGQILDLGEWSADGEFEVQIDWYNGQAGNVTITCATINDASYNEMLANFSTSPLQVSSYDSSHLTGTVDVKEEGVLFLTVTKDAGWTARVNGQKKDITFIADALLGIPLEPGVHLIELSYEPVGFRAGLLVSLASATIFLMLFLLSRRKNTSLMLSKERERYPEIKPDTLPEDMREMTETGQGCIAAGEETSQTSEGKEQGTSIDESEKGPVSEDEPVPEEKSLKNNKTTDVIREDMSDE